MFLIAGGTGRRIRVLIAGGSRNKSDSNWKYSEEAARGARRQSGIILGYKAM